MEENVARWEEALTRKLMNALLHVDSTLRSKSPRHAGDISVKAVSITRDELMEALTQYSADRDAGRPVNSPYFRVEITLSDKAAKYGEKLAKFIQGDSYIKTVWDAEKRTIIFGDSIHRLLSWDLQDLGVLLLKDRDKAKAVRS